MHAYLLIGSDKEKIEEQIDQLTKKLSAGPMEFSISKIDDVRSLNSFTALSLNKKTAVIVKEVENVTSEALNAFLKNLEEPQENLFYILTARSLHSLLPTIISRCQVIKISDDGQDIDSENIEKLLAMKVNQKFAFFDKLKKRDEAVTSIENILYFLHNQLVQKEGDRTLLSKQISATQQTLNNLKANGNVNLQLTNWAINTGITDTFNPKGHQV